MSEKHLNIQRAIKLHNLTQAKVVEKMNEQASLANEDYSITLQSFKNTLQVGNPTTKTLIRIAEAIGCPVGELFDDFREAAQDALRCPKCGTPLNIEIKEQE